MMDKRIFYFKWAIKKRVKMTCAPPKLFGGDFQRPNCLIWLLHTSTDALGHIISDSTRGHWGFWSFNFIPPHPGDPTWSDQFLACFRAAFVHSLSLVIHSLWEAFSAASEALLMVCLFHAPLMPRSTCTAISLPLPPTSMDMHWVRHPGLRHSSASLVYFPLFRSSASSILSSQALSVPGWRLVLMNFTPAQYLVWKW